MLQYRRDCQLASIQSVAPLRAVEVTPIGVAEVAEMEHSVATFAAAPDGGLILTASALSLLHRDFTIGLAARYKLPAIYGTMPPMIRRSPVVWYAMGQTCSTGPGVRPATSIASSRARGRPIFLFKRPPNTSLSST
jgi:hypothetical protein